MHRDNRSRRTPSLETPRHQDGGSAEAAADVGHLGSAAQLRLDAAERGDPACSEVHQVARAEEPLDAVVERVMMLVPAHAFAGAERIFNLVHVVEAGQDDLERSGQERGAVLRGQHHRLLWRQGVGLRCGIVGDVAAGGIRVQPLADISLAGFGARGKLGRGDGFAVGHGLVQAQPVAQQDEYAVHGRAHVAHGLDHKVV